MKRVIGIILIVGALVLGYFGINGLSESSTSVEVMGLELKAEDNNGKREGIHSTWIWRFSPYCRGISGRTEEKITAASPQFFQSNFLFLNLYFQSLTTHLSPHRINRRRGKGRADYGKKKKEENFRNQKKRQSVAQFF